MVSETFPQPFYDTHLEYRFFPRLSSKTRLPTWESGDFWCIFLIFPGKTLFQPWEMNIVTKFPRGGGGSLEGFSVFLHKIH